MSTYLIITVGTKWIEKTKKSVYHIFIEKVEKKGTEEIMKNKK